MKKIYYLVALMLLGGYSWGQTPFFTPTAYRGAFAPAPATEWTSGWTNWDPQHKFYPASTVDVTAAITSNTTWTSTNVYHLKGVIYVKNGATLTIQAGTIIKGDKATPNSSLIITKGAKIMAVGTATSPIVFTSDQDTAQRNLGDWGGVIILGKATNNNPGDTGNVEGLAPTSDTQYGGGANPDDNDNSGVMQYVRIEFPGYVFQPSKEINGLTFGSVGRGTSIDHIQVSFSNDDSYEWFGGTVNCKYMIAYRGLDDDFDTDNGYSGYVQFGLSVRDPQIADNPTVSTSEGFESDNDPSGTTAAPQTRAIFSNMTLIGPYRGNTTSSIATGYRRGARIRRNSALKIMNSVFIDHSRGIHIDGALSEANATNGTLKFKNNIVAGNSTGRVCEVNAGSSFDIHSWFSASKNDSFVSTTGILITPYNFTTPDYRPAAASPALMGADFLDAIFSGLVFSVQKPIVGFNYIQDTAKGSLKYNFTNTTDEKGNPVLYRWKFTNNIADTSSLKNTSFIFAAKGSYIVTLYALSTSGIDSISQNINAIPTYVNGIIQTLINVCIYPNPASENVTVSYTSQAAPPVRIDLYEITGKFVKSMPSEQYVSGNNKITMGTSELNQGWYLLKVSSADFSKTFKLVISK